METTQDNDKLNFKNFYQTVDDKKDEGGFLSMVLSGKCIFPPTVHGHAPEPAIKTTNLPDTDQAEKSSAWPACNSAWHISLPNATDDKDQRRKKLIPSAYCGFPLSESTRNLLARCHLLKIADFPVSFACGPTIHISKEKLFQCPCFQAAFYPCNVLEDTPWHMEYFEAEFYDHIHKDCEYCKNQNIVPAVCHKLLREKPTSLPMVPNGILLDSMIQDELLIQKCSIGLGPPIETRRNEQKGSLRMSPTLTIQRPFVPIHLGHNRFFDEHCNKGCPSPIEASSVLRGLDPTDHVTLYGNSIMKPSAVCQSKGTKVPASHDGPSVQHPARQVRNTHPIETLLTYYFYITTATFLLYWLVFSK